MVGSRYVVSEPVRHAVAELAWLTGQHGWVSRTCWEMALYGSLTTTAERAWWRLLDRLGRYGVPADSRGTEDRVEVRLAWTPADVERWARGEEVGRG